MKYEYDIWNILKSSFNNKSQWGLLIFTCLSNLIIFDLNVLIRVSHLLYYIFVWGGWRRECVLVNGVVEIMIPLVTWFTKMVEKLLLNSIKYPQCEKCMHSGKKKKNQHSLKLCNTYFACLSKMQLGSRHFFVSQCMPSSTRGNSLFGNLEGILKDTCFPGSKTVKDNNLWEGR